MGHFWSIDTLFRIWVVLPSGHLCSCRNGTFSWASQASYGRVRKTWASRAIIGYYRCHLFFSYLVFLINQWRPYRPCPAPRPFLLINHTPLALEKGKENLNHIFIFSPVVSCGFLDLPGFFWLVGKCWMSLHKKKITTLLPKPTVYCKLAIFLVLSIKTMIVSNCNFLPAAVQRLWKVTSSDPIYFTHNASKMTTGFVFCLQSI